EQHAEASQLAAYLRISASEIDDVIDRLERLRKTPGDEEPVGLHPFDRDRLATVHAIAEHPPRLFGDLKRRFRSTELPRLPREAARDRRVQLPACFLQLRCEGHFLRQRMLEEILADRIERLLVDELGVLELLQSFAQLRRVLLDDGRQGWLIEFPSDDRRAL